MGLLVPGEFVPWTLPWCSSSSCFCRMGRFQYFFLIDATRASVAQVVRPSSCQRRSPWRRPQPLPYLQACASFGHRCLGVQGRPEMKCKFFPGEIEAFTMCTQGGGAVRVTDEGSAPLRTRGTIGSGWMGVGMLQPGFRAEARMGWQKSVRKVSVLAYPTLLFSRSFDSCDCPWHSSFDLEGCGSCDAWIAGEKWWREKGILCRRCDLPIWIG